MSTVGNKFAIFQYQFTSTVYWTSSVLVNSRNCQKMHSQSAWWRQTDLHTSWRALVNSRQGRGGKGRVGEGRRKREGVAFTIGIGVFLQFNDWSAVIVAATYTCFTLPFPPLPCREAAPWKPARGSGSSVSFSSGVRDEAPAAYAFWCIFNWKSAHGGNMFFYKRSKKKNSCIGKKCWNDVQKFTSTKISGEFRISGGIPPGYMYGRNTAAWRKSRDKYFKCLSAATENASNAPTLPQMGLR